MFTLLLTTFFFTYHLGTDLFNGAGENISEGQLWNSKTLIAENSFPLIKSRKKYNQEVESIKTEVLPNFIVFNNINSKVLDEIYLVIDTSFVFKNYNYDTKTKKTYEENLFRLKRQIKEELEIYVSKGVIDKNKSDFSNSSFIAVNDKNEQTILNFDKVLITLSLE